jgi:hypothetical protein
MSRKDQVITRSSTGNRSHRRTGWRRVGQGPATRSTTYVSVVTQVSQYPITGASPALAGGEVGKAQKPTAPFPKAVADDAAPDAAPSEEEAPEVVPVSEAKTVGV